MGHRHSQQEHPQMTQPGPPDIPQELIDEIIDHCSGDKRTLKACSLTSRAWVHRTRKHLFSKLTLTDKTLPVWCGIVVTPTTGSKPHPLPGSYPPVSSSYASSWLSSYVTSLQLVPKYCPKSSNGLGAKELLLAKSHLSAFTHLESLTLAAVSFVDFDDASLETCFGSLAKTVQELKLWMCSLDEERFCGFLRLFTRLESFAINGNVWLSSESTGETKILQRGLPTLRGSFAVSELTDGNGGLLDTLTTARVEYHTITLGYNLPSAFHKLNVLFAKCKSHLETLSLTALEWGLHYRSDQGQVLDLSPCAKLVEIQAQFNHGDFGRIVLVLRTVASPRFRRLTLLITSRMRLIKGENWTKLEGEVIALAKRVNATAVSDTLEVLFSSYSTTLGELVLSDVERVLPRVASDALVSLRVENLPLPFKR